MTPLSAEYFENMCRACMFNYDHILHPDSQPIRLYSIYDHRPKGRNSTTEVQIVQLLTSITPALNIQPLDKLPKTICSNCVRKLQELNDFQEMCANSQKNMLSMIDTNENSTNQLDPLEAPSDIHVKLEDSIDLQEPSPTESLSVQMEFYENEDKDSKYIKMKSENQNSNDSDWNRDDEEPLINISASDQ